MRLELLKLSNASKSVKVTRSGKKIILFPSLILVLSVIGLVWYIINFQRQLVETSALESAKLYSQALTEFRTIYTAKVVKVINPHPDIEVTHDYAAHKNAIPLPATLSMELGKQIGKHLSGAETWLYSQYPFPWRKKNDGGLRDKFSVKAWESLNENPNEPFYEFVPDYNGRPVLRYATADVMRAACVNCHNDHPQSPKTDWQINEVRGILEIVHPMEAIANTTQEGKQKLIILASGISLFGALSLFLFIRGYQRINADLEKKVLIRTKNLKQAKDEAVAAAEEINKINQSLLQAKEETELYQEKLLESNKMASLGAMSSGIAHELNQPLGAILLKTQLVLKFIEKGNFDKIKSINEAVMDQVLRAKKIMDSLRIFSREDKTLQREHYDINKLILDICVLFHDEFNLSKVNFDLNLTEQEIVANISPVQIGQVLANLITNARDAVEENDDKNVSICSQLEQGEIIIEVSDNGYGIPEEIISKIFEPFYTTKAVGKGTGLGLSLSYSMIKDNGGEIIVKSTVGEGTVFKLVIPAIGVNTSE